MDELLLRCEQVIEQIQLCVRMTAENSLAIVRQYSHDGYAFVHDQASVEALRQASRQAWQSLGRSLAALRRSVAELPNARELLDHLRSLVRDEMCRNNALYLCCGICIGTVGGFVLGIYWTQPLTPPVMKSIACTHFFGPSCVNLCQTPMPTFGRRPCDVLIRVRAATISRLDGRIASGYGRTFRRLMSALTGDEQCGRDELPLVLGRGCAGVVEGVGPGASRSGLEIGDEVWLAASWWERGLAAEMVVAPECRVARKPFIIGFEGAASLPYSGCVALMALRRAGLDATTCAGKRVLVQDGCSPVGCVLTQLCRKWGAASVAATCAVRSVPVIKALGADDVIAIEPDADESFAQERHVLFKELSIRPEFDVIFYTTSVDYDRQFMDTFLSRTGRLIDTIETEHAIGDRNGFFGRIMFSVYVRMRRLYAYCTKTRPNWGGPHLCHTQLDRLAEYVNDGLLQTVVDQVYTPQDADAAMLHADSTKSIGSTIVTFRS